MADSSPLRVAASLGSLAVLQLAAGLAMQLIVIAIVGAGVQTDAFVAAQTVPLLLVSILAVPLASAWQPRLAVAIDDPGSFVAQQGLAQGQALLATGACAAVCVATTWAWLPLLFPGLDARARALAGELTPILCFGAVLNAQTLLLITAFRARSRFVTPEAVVAATAVVAVMATWLLVPMHGVLGAAWISLARAALAFTVLFLLCGRPVPRPLAAFRQRDAWSRFAPLLAGSSIYKTSPLIDRYWGSHAPTGGLTALSLAQTGMSALAQVIERGVSVPVIPRLARLAAAREHTEMKAVIRRSVQQALVATGCVFLVLLFIRPWWTQLLGQAGFGAEIAQQLWWLGVLMLGMLHVSACGTVPVAAFIALGDSRTPVQVGIIAFLLSVALKSAGFIYGGLPGFALATSVFYVGNLVTLSLLLRRRLNAGRY